MLDPLHPKSGAGYPSINQQLHQKCPPSKLNRRQPANHHFTRSNKNLHVQEVVNHAVTCLPRSPTTGSISRDTRGNSSQEPRNRNDNNSNSLATLPTHYLTKPSPNLTCACSTPDVHILVHLLLCSLTTTQPHGSRYQLSISLSTP